MASIQQELRRFGLLPKKRLGQHFLVDRKIIEKMIQTAEVQREDVVLEVGPGLGEMTLGLARLAQQVIAVEIDAQLAEILKQKTSSLSNVTVLVGDILQTDLEGLSDRIHGPLKVVANLPYQISTPLLFRLIELRHLFSSLTLMLQREVVERIIAPPGGKAYGALSVVMQSVSDPSLRFFVKPASFYPPPQVESAVVRIAWRENPLLGRTGEEWFRRVVKACFGYRRKTLLNALKHSNLVPPESLERRIKAVGIDPKRRPETLSLEEFLHLAEGLKGPQKIVCKTSGQ